MNQILGMKYLKIINWFDFDLEPNFIKQIYISFSILFNSKINFSWLFKKRQILANLVFLLTHKLF